MLFSTKNSLNNSASLKPTSKSINKKKETFLGYIFRRFKQSLMSLWMHSRKFLWISSTALIIVFLPFAFSYFIEMQNELMKINGMQGRFNQM